MTPVRSAVRSKRRARPGRNAHPSPTAFALLVPTGIFAGVAAERALDDWLISAIAALLVVLALVWVIQAAGARPHA